MPNIRSYSSDAVRLAAGDVLFANGEGEARVWPSGERRAIHGSESFGPYAVDSVCSVVAGTSSISYRVQPAVAAPTEVEVDSAQLTAAVSSAVADAIPRRYVPPRAEQSLAAVFAALLSANVVGAGLQDVEYAMAATLNGTTFPSNVHVVGTIGRTLFKNPDATNVAGYLFRSNFLTNVTIDGVGFDLNATNNTGYIGGFNTPNGGNVTIRNCDFKDGRARPFAYVNGGEWTFENCAFRKHTDVMLIIAGNVRTAACKFINCYFEDWNNGTPTTGSNQNPGFGNNCCVRLSPRCDFTLFDGCWFKNTVSRQFAIEAPTGSSQLAYIVGLVVRNCYFDGNDVGGSGVSGPMLGAVIDGNLFVNGNNSHRTGIEIVGRYNQVTNNRLMDGSILMAEVNPVVDEDGFSKSQIVTGNTIRVTKSAGASQVRCMDFSGQMSGRVYGNIIDASEAPAGTNLIAIALGSNVEKKCGTLVIETNTLVSRGNLGHGIRQNFSQTDSIPSSGIKIRNNTITGFAWAWSLDGSGDTDLEFTGNDCRGCGVMRAGTGVPGARFRYGGNTRPDGQLESVDTRTLAAAAVHTPNGMGLTKAALTLNGAVTIAEPVDAEVGSELAFTFIQGGAGSHTITWNPAFAKAADGTGAAASVGVVKFTKVRASGVGSWQQTSGALTFA
jgi:hypothetical protein